MDQELKQLLEDIRKMYHDAKIYLFGSRARGDFKPESDYDLIIVSKEFKQTPFVNRGGTIWRNTDAALAADLLCYTPEEFEKVRTTSIVIKDAMKHAVPL